MLSAGAVTATAGIDSTDSAAAGGGARLRRLRTAAFLLILVGLALRLATVLETPPHPGYASAPYKDEIHYRQLARNLIEFREFTAFAECFQTHSTRSPVYPAALSIAYRLSGHHPAAHLWLNLILEAVTIFLIWTVAARLYGPLAGMLAGVCHAFYGAVFYKFVVSTPQMLAITLVLATTLCMVSFLRDGGTRLQAWGLAVSFALLAHTRPVFLVLGPVFALIVWFRAPCPWQRRLFAIGLAIALCLPWALRNYVHHRTLVPVCTMAGWHLATHARSTDQLSYDMLMDYVYEPEHRGWTEGEFYRDAMSESRRMALSDPLKTTAIGIGRVWHQWRFHDPHKRIFSPKAYLHPVQLGTIRLPLLDFEGMCYSTLIVALVCLIRMRRRAGPILRRWWRRGWLLLVLLAAYTAAHIISIPFIQYRQNMEPLVVILMIGFLLNVFRLSGWGGRGYGKHRISTTKGLILGLTAIVALYAILFVCAFGTYPRKNRHIATANTGAMGRQQLGMPQYMVDYDYRNGRPLHYEEVQKLQWADSGRIPEGTRMLAVGTIRHVAKGYQFVPDQLACVRAAGAVGKLEVEKYIRSTPLGIGDVLVNFADCEPPENDRAILIAGTVTTGAFRELILTVHKYRYWSAQWTP